MKLSWWLNRGRTSWVRRAPDCIVGDRGFDSPGLTSTQGVKITEKWRYHFCTASGETFTWLRWPCKRAVVSPVGDIKIVHPISTFVLNTNWHWHWNKVLSLIWARVSSPYICTIIFLLFIAVYSHASKMLKNPLKTPAFPGLW